MKIDEAFARILGEWLHTLRGTPHDVAAWKSNGFSNANLWRVNFGNVYYCLKCSPINAAMIERLPKIHATLAHVWREGRHFVPVPVLNGEGKSFVAKNGFLWELAPWMPGQANYSVSPSESKLRAAAIALADFHLASSTFSWGESRRGASPGIVERHSMLSSLMLRDAEILRKAIRPTVWPALADRAGQLLNLFQYLAPELASPLENANGWEVPLQPCIRDVWHDHLLYTGDTVTGLIDFGAMRIDNVATDLARLLGSFVSDDPQGWKIGLSAYQERRPLSDVELALIPLFDRCGILLSGLNWLRWVFLERRQFDQPDRVLSRVDSMLSRLHLWRNGGVATIPPHFSR